MKSLTLTFGYPEGNMFLTTKPKVLARQLTGVRAKDLDNHAEKFGLSRTSQTRPHGQIQKRRRTQHNKAGA
jgi:hypothetical protein